MLRRLDDKRGGVDRVQVSHLKWRDVHFFLQLYLSQPESGELCVHGKGARQKLQTTLNPTDDSGNYSVLKLYDEVVREGEKGNILVYQRWWEKGYTLSTTSAA